MPGTVNDRSYLADENRGDPAHHEQLNQTTATAPSPVAFFSEMP